MRLAVRQSGFSMLEVLVSLMILVFGLLGLLGLQARAQIAELESYQRGQALILVQDMVGRLNANRKAAGCYVTSTITGSGALGTGYGGTPVCVAGSGTVATRAVADIDLAAWNNALLGTSETKSGASVGSIVGARGCVSYDAVTGVYRVAVAWQGMAPTISPATADALAICGLNAYHSTGGSDALRREVSVSLRIANLL
jgi:type IV pilus assembly protein PilV